MTAFDQPASETGVPYWRRALVRSRPDDRTSDTPQTPGMRRYAAISGGLTGSHGLWMGGNTVGPGQKSADHHHGEADSGIYVDLRPPPLRVPDQPLRDAHRRRAGDFVYVPAWVPHREENPSDDEDAVVVLARSTPEEIVVNLPSLWSVDGAPPRASE